MNARKSVRPEVLAVPEACWTDASGNYLGEGLEAAVEAYVSVESRAGRLLCPGCRRAARHLWSADPARLAGLVYFGTSDENLYLKCESEPEAAEF